MAKIFYSLAGEGRGHATRVRGVIEELRADHRVVVYAPHVAFDFLSGIYAETDVEVRKINGLKFMYSGQRLDYAATTNDAFCYLSRLPRLVDSLVRDIDEERPDLVITDFEPALPRAAVRCGIPFISLDHQHSLCACDHSIMPLSLRTKAWAMGKLVEQFYSGQVETIVSSFYFPPLNAAYRDAVQIGVLLRPELRKLNRTNAGHLLVYLRKSASPQLLQALSELGMPVKVYGLGVRPSQGPVSFHAISETEFIHDLAACEALVCSAGNQLVGEALYLGKPVFAIPELNNAEQYINGHFLQSSGCGIWVDADLVDTGRLKQFVHNLDLYRSRMDPERMDGNPAAIDCIRRHLPPPANRKLAIPWVPVRPRKVSILSRSSAFVTNLVANRLTPVGDPRHGQSAVHTSAAMGPRANSSARSSAEVKVPLPRLLTFTVTFGCNARCIMCDSWKLPTAGDLRLDEIANIFDQLPTLDGVRLTGGEPFVRRDFAEISRLAVERLRPMLLHITTNGFLTERVVDFCERRRKTTPLELLISIDGVGEKHNQVRGSSLAWNSVMETVKAIAPRQRELGLKLFVNQTIVDAEGIEHYRKLRDVLKPYGVRNNVVLAYDTSATYNTQRDLELAPSEIGEFKTFGEFDASHLAELLAEIERDLATYPLLQRIAKRYYLKGITNRLMNGIGDPNPRCVALRSHLRIFPNGDVPTCQFNSRIVGNLREQSFAEIWSSPSMQQQRAWVDRCPGCWAECEVLPSAIYTGDLLLNAFRPATKIDLSKAAGNRLKGMHNAPVASPDTLVPIDGLHAERENPASGHSHNNHSGHDAHAAQATLNANGDFGHSSGTATQVLAPHANSAATPSSQLHELKTPR